MSEQHYGRAPCGCERLEAGLVAVCWEHKLTADGPPWWTHWGRGPTTNITEDNYPRVAFPWAAASALEAGLRAIAGWPASELPCVEVAGKDGRVVRVYADPYVMGLYLVNRIESSDTERPKPNPAAFIANRNREMDGLARNALEDDMIAALESWPSDEDRKRIRAEVDAMSKDEVWARVYPEGLTKCYFCAKPVIDGRCSKCDKEQPPGEG